MLVHEPFNFSGEEHERYHILEQLGEGGMATVYKAYDMRLERDVAIKIIRRGAFPPEQLSQIMARFEREAKSLARLSHPNIVKVHDFGEYKGSPYLVMEYLPGGTLKSILGQPIPWAVAMRMLLPVARALAYAHEHGIIHRDVKPANIIISASGDPMLTDFGIAKLLENEDGKTLTGSGVGIGTPEYMSPEQGIGNIVNERADMYSLGVVLYEMITGRRPYTADTPMAVVLKQINDPLPTPKLYAQDLPDAVEQIIIKAMAKDPSNRFENMNVLCKLMEDWLSAPTLPAAAPETANTIVPILAGKPNVKDPTPKPAQWSLAQWATVAGISILIVGILGFGLFYFIRKPEAALPPPVILPVATIISVSTPTVRTSLSAPATWKPSPTLAQTSTPMVGLVVNEEQLIVGTINLEGTELAVSKEQATILLPLWNNLKTFNHNLVSGQAQTSGTPQPPILDAAAQQQKDALIKAILSAMTPEQITAIAGMQITRQNAVSILQSKGITLYIPQGSSPLGPPQGISSGGSQPGNNPGSRQGTPVAGGSNPGNRPQGTPSGGGQPGGGLIGDLINVLIQVLSRSAAE